MRILALDTATLATSVALVDGDRVLAEGEGRADPRSERLLPLVDEVLRAAALPPSAIEAVACGRGPGSFTGLRIGLATAKGLCFALGRPLVMVSSLRALAQAGAGRGAPVLAVLNAYRQEVYAALFDASGAPAGPERVLPPARLEEVTGGARVVIVGDGALAYPDDAARCGAFLADARPTPAARAVAALAAPRLAAGERDDLDAASPTYLRPPVG